MPEMPGPVVAVASAVLDEDRSVTAVAAACDCTWNTCHDAVAAADPVPDVEPEPVRVLGIDKTRRGKAKYETGRPTLSEKTAVVEANTMLLMRCLGFGHAPVYCGGALGSSGGCSRGSPCGVLESIR
jgi:hypothetical protein